MLSLRCVRSIINIYFRGLSKMNSRKFIRFSAALVILLTIVSSSSQSTVSFSDGNTLEVPDEPRYYCGIELHRAVRSYCRETVIEVFKKKEPLKVGFQKPSRCGITLLEHCCRHKCDMATFVKYCPYRYIRR